MKDLIKIYQNAAFEGKNCNTICTCSTCNCGDSCPGSGCSCGCVCCQ